MLVAVHYQFHDHEPENIVIDTDKLSVTDKYLKECGITDPESVAANHKWWASLKKKLEGKNDYISFDGAKLTDEGGIQIHFYVPKYAIVKPKGATIASQKTVEILFE